MNIDILKKIISEGRFVINPSTNTITLFGKSCDKQLREAYGDISELGNKLMEINKSTEKEI